MQNLAGFGRNRIDNKLNTEALLLKRQIIKKEIVRLKRNRNKYKWRGDLWVSREAYRRFEKEIENRFKSKDKTKKQEEFLLNHPDSKFVGNKSQKLRCQINGCRNGAVTLLGKKKVCRNHSKKEVKDNARK